jgi:enterochelin esterase-like enzyme
MRVIESEVLPRVAQAYVIRFTGDSEGRATMGGNSGGAAAFTMAWSHPELYRRVLSYSGTFVNEANPLHPGTVTRVNAALREAQDGEALLRETLGQPLQDTWMAYLASQPNATTPEAWRKRSAAQYL